MRKSFWKAALISLGAYAAALLPGWGGNFRLVLFAVLALQVTWTLFCVVRMIQLRSGGGYKPDAPPSDRESYGFALGGSISSLALLAVIVVLTQVV
jgi:hypothetical protein